MVYKKDFLERKSMLPSNSLLEEILKFANEGIDPYTKIKNIKKLLNC